MDITIKIGKGTVRIFESSFYKSFTNGTLPIMVALQALRITGKLLQLLQFCGNNPFTLVERYKTCFVDIDPKTGNLDPEK